MNSNFYKIYGFTLESKFAIPELPQITGPADVIIDWRDSNIEVNHEAHSIRGDRQSMELRFPGVAVFKVRNGNEIIIVPAPNADLEHVRAYLLGMVLGILLYQRGFVIMHASCIGLDGQACLFAGQVGAGKSTFASALLSNGGKLLADDITAIKIVNGVPVVQPGFPMMRLQPMVAEMNVAENLPSCPQPLAKYGKRGFLLHDFFDATPQPLRAIYVLSMGTDASMERISGARSLIACLPHLYLQIDNPQDHAVLLRKLSEVLKIVSVYEFTRPLGLDRLSQDCLRLKDHFLVSQRKVCVQGV